MRRTGRRPGGAMVRMILGAMLLTASCGPSAAGGGGTVTPGGNGNVRDAAEPEGQEEGNDVGALRERLERLGREQDQRVSASGFRRRNTSLPF